VAVDDSDMTVVGGELAAERARLQVLRRALGAHLATCRIAAGVSQPRVGRAVGRTRSMISKIEHGTRALPAALWKIADEVCGAQGVLVAEYQALARAERDYRDRYRTHRHQTQARRARAGAVLSWPVFISPAVLLYSGEGAWPQITLASVDGGCAEVVEELMAVVGRLVRLVGRRGAMQLAGSVLAAAGLCGLDDEEFTRLAQAVDSPQRVDAQVVNNLGAMLAYCKRLEDKLGPCQVADTVTAQHRLVHRLLDGGCPEPLRKSLRLVDSNMASAIGGYLLDMGHPAEAKDYLAHARKAAHDAGNPAYAAYAAINSSFAAFLRADTPAALDGAAAARSLAARTDDARLKALAEQMAAEAYALDGQYGPCMAASARAHDLLTTTHGGAPESPAYWVDHGMIDTNHSTLLVLLGKRQHAVEAARTALAHFDRTYVRLHAVCEVRLGHALILCNEISEATHVLGNATPHAHLSPRLTAELHAARALLHPWNNTPAVKTLDAQLEIYQLHPATPSAPGRP
jgi:transcriptional regulator with XRE-family HTH domain